MKSKIAMGITTCDKISVAREIVAALLEDELIACGQIEDPITSMFWWNNAFQESKEWRVTVKFKLENAKKIQNVVEAKNNYETPQWVYWELESSPDFSDWVRNPRN